MTANSATYNPLKRRAKELARKCSTAFISTALTGLGWDGTHSTEDDYLARLDPMRDMLLMMEDTAASLIEQRLYEIQREQDKRE
jgi:hypothetical protein